MTTENVTREQDPDRYQITVDGEAAGQAQFLDIDNQRVFYHTEVGEEFSGRGLAGTLVQQSLEQTRADGQRIVPVCPYVAKFVTRSDEFTDLVDKPTPAILQALERARG